MKKQLSVLAISTLLLTGCSTPTPESQPEYDALELIRYESCINAITNGMYENSIRKSWINSPFYVETAKDLCLELEPVKK